MVEVAFDVLDLDWHIFALPDLTTKYLQNDSWFESFP